MSELNSEQPSEPTVKDRFYDSLESTDDCFSDYASLVIDLQSYIADELSIEEEAAGRLISEWKIPTSDDFDKDSLEAKKKLALIIFTNLAEFRACLDDRSSDVDWYVELIEHTIGTHGEDNGECFTGRGDSGHCSAGLCPYKIIFGTIVDRLVEGNDAEISASLFERVIGTNVAMVEALAHRKIQILSVNQETDMIRGYKTWLDRREVNYDAAMFTAYC